MENAGPNEEFGTSIWNSIKDGDFGRHSWVAQEIGKGGQFLFACTFLTFSHCQGGWEFNYNDDDLKYIGKVELQGENDREVNVKLSAQEVIEAFENNTLTDEHIAQFGFFRRFEDEYLDLYAPIKEGNELRTGGASISAAQAEATELETQWRLLGHAIPAQSYAAAANSLSIIDDSSIGGVNRNFDMPGLRDGASLGWPQERLNDVNLGDDWLHSDFRNVAMPYVFPIFENMLDIGELREKQP